MIGRTRIYLSIRLRIIQTYNYLQGQKLSIYKKLKRKSTIFVVLLSYLFRDLMILDLHKKDTKHFEMLLHIENHGLNTLL